MRGTLKGVALAAALATAVSMAHAQSSGSGAADSGNRTPATGTSSQRTDTPSGAAAGNTRLSGPGQKALAKRSAGALTAVTHERQLRAWVKRAASTPKATDV